MDEPKTVTASQAIADGDAWAEAYNKRCDLIWDKYRDAIIKSTIRALGDIVTREQLNARLNLYSVAFAEIKATALEASRHLMNNKIVDSPFMRDRIYHIEKIIEDLIKKIKEQAEQGE